MVESAVYRAKGQGARGDWCIGLLVYWFIGILVYWYIGILVLSAKW